MQRAIVEFEVRMRQHQHSIKQEQLNTTMGRTLFEQMDVAEVYSRPRTAEMAHHMGLRAGWGLDLITYDEQGRAWNSDCKYMRNAAARQLLQDKPRLLIDSPMCGLAP